MGTGMGAVVRDLRLECVGDEGERERTGEVDLWRFDPLFDKPGE